jgi:hypothetical protein
MSNSLPKPNPIRKPPPEVDAVWFTKTMLTFDLCDGRSISVPLSFYAPLLGSDETKRLEYEIHGGFVYWESLGLKLASSDLLYGRRKAGRSRA